MKKLVGFLVWIVGLALAVSSSGARAATIVRSLAIIRTTLPRVTLALLLLAPISGRAADSCKFVGNAAYSYIGTSIALTVDQVVNQDASGISGPLVIELWALAAPYAGVADSGYKLAVYPIGQLAAGKSISNVNSGPISFTSPPSGTWIFALILTEGGAPVDWRNFDPAVVIPQIGLWAGIGESGSGYALDYRHGVLVVTVYSYQQAGAPQWYLAAGSLVGTTFSATLDKYIGGQCISCAYAGPPQVIGNDGTITINFVSSTSATVSLPGGRVTQIQPQPF
jgi:hypothetical protein